MQRLLIQNKKNHTTVPPLDCGYPTPEAQRRMPI